jgi:nicotinamidase-related amidase
VASNTALIVIDMQVGAFEAPDPVFDGAGLLTRINTLIGLARAARHPIIYVQHCEPPGGRFEPHTPGWAIHPAVAPRTDDLIIHKPALDAFTDTTLDHELRARQIAALIMTGIVTEHSYSATCNQAVQRGYHITIVADGHTTYGTTFLPATEVIAAYNAYVFAPLATLQAAHEISFIEQRYLGRDA